MLIFNLYKINHTWNLYPSSSAHHMNISFQIWITQHKCLALSCTRTCCMFYLGSVVKKLPKVKNDKSLKDVCTFFTKLWFRQHVYCSVQAGRGKRPSTKNRTGQRTQTVPSTVQPYNSIGHQLFISSIVDSSSWLDPDNQTTRALLGHGSEIGDVSRVSVSICTI